MINIVEVFFLLLLFVRLCVRDRDFDVNACASYVKYALAEWMICVRK